MRMCITPASCGNFLVLQTETQKYVPLKMVYLKVYFSLMYVLQSATPYALYGYYFAYIPSKRCVQNLQVLVLIDFSVINRSSLFWTQFLGQFQCSGAEQNQGTFISSLLNTISDCGFNKEIAGLGRGLLNVTSLPKEHQHKST